MSDTNAESFLEQEYNDKETQDFFDKKGEVENAAQDDDSSSTHSAETGTEKSLSRGSDKSESAVSEETENQEVDEEDNGKQLNDQERYKAMAAEERNRRREIQKQIDTLAKENEQLKSTFNKILTKAQEQAEAQNVPSYEDNPIEALRYENEQLKKKVGHIEQTTQQRDQQAQQQYEMQQRQKQFVDTYRAQANEFKKAQSDFEDAYNYLLETREQEYKVAGYPDDMVHQLLVEDEAAIVANALNNGRNPAKALYDLAKLRGYKQQSNIASQDKINANNEKIANLERGLKASKSVNSGGMNAKDNLTLESVAEMSEDEIDSIDWNKLMKLG